MGQSKIKDLLKRGGVPQPFRGLVWCKFCNLRQSKAQKQNKGLYKSLLCDLNCNEYADIIWKDIRRTFRDNMRYKQLVKNEDEQFIPTESQKSLFNVLAAYSSYNETIGYCQGMQAISALLLMFMEEENVFFVLNIIATHKKYGSIGHVWNMSEINLRFKQFEYCINICIKMELLMSVCLEQPLGLSQYLFLQIALI